MSEVKIVEVGPRDGLQNEKEIIGTEDKLTFIDGLIASGLKNIEITSFVKPPSIPQMKDSVEVAKSVVKKYANQNLTLLCLVPNLYGLEKARESGIKEIALFTSASNSFNQKNINTDLEGSLKRIEEVVANAAGLKMRAYLSCVFGCPYEGKIPFEDTYKLIKKLLDLGAYEISIGDTIGIGKPDEVKEFLSELKTKFSLDNMAMHFHDTNNLAIDNIGVSLDMGVRVFDSSAGGLGGCPYAKGASGNVATEKVVDYLERRGFSTGIDLDKLKKASKFILNKVNKS